MLSVATALLVLFVSLKQAPQPEWQGFVSVRGLQVWTSAQVPRTARSSVQGMRVASSKTNFKCMSRCVSEVNCLAATMLQVIQRVQSEHRKTCSALHCCRHVCSDLTF